MPEGFGMGHQLVFRHVYWKCCWRFEEKPPVRKETPAPCRVDRLCELASTARVVPLVVLAFWGGTFEQEIRRARGVGNCSSCCQECSSTGHPGVEPSPSFNWRPDFRNLPMVNGQNCCGRALKVLRQPLWEPGEARGGPWMTSLCVRSVLRLWLWREKSRWPDRAVANKIETGSVIPFESTPLGWNLTVELEAPNDANSELQEVMDILMTEKRLEQTENIDHMRGLPLANKTNVDWTTWCVLFTTFWMAGHRPVGPHERSLGPLSETDGDETMMDNPGDDDAGETSAV